MHHTFMHTHIPNPKFMFLAETSTFGIFRGRNVQAETSVAEMSVAEMSEHPLQETRSFVDSINLPKIEFISKASESLAGT